MPEQKNHATFYFLMTLDVDVEGANINLASFPGSLFLLCADGEKESLAYTVGACAKYCFRIAVNRTIAQIIATDIEYGWKNLQFLSNRG